MADKAETNYTFQGNKLLDKELFNYAGGNVFLYEYLQKLQETDKEIVTEGGLEDFLKIPVIEGYKNNMTRVPNNFENITMKIDVSGNQNISKDK
jgi:hypothetical protein